MLKAPGVVNTTGGGIDPPPPTDSVLPQIYLLRMR